MAGRADAGARAEPAADMRVRNFKSIDQVLCLIEQGLSPRLFPDHQFDYHWLKDGILAPSVTSSFTSPYLYRGQVARYQNCVPGVFRGLAFVDDPRKLSRQERARCFLDRVRLEEFLLALEKHPACGFASEIGLKVFPHSIAQHYELMTDRIDLTQDHRVAAFFATNEKVGQTWRPIDNGVGVMHRLAIGLFSRNLPEHLECVGKQALPRPGEQKAWTLRLPIGRDFETYPIEIFTFDHDPAAGERIHAEFAGGKRLFPPDVLSEVAEAIKMASSISRQMVGKVLTLHGLTGRLHAKEMEASVSYFDRVFGLPVADRVPIELGAEQLVRADAAVKRMRKAFFKDVGLLAVRRVQAEA